MRRYLLLSLSLLVAANGCSSSTGPDLRPEFVPITELPRPLSAAEVEVLDASNEFGLDLLRRIHAPGSVENTFISPLSASMALGMALNGTAGETFEAMREALAFGDMELGDINAAYRSLIDLLQGLDPLVSFHLGNSVWHRDGWTPESDYLEVVTSTFDAEIEGLDFDDPASAGVINSWVSDATNGRIEEIVQAPIDPLTVLFLINAVDFEGLWTDEFDPDDTRDAPFHNGDGTTSTARLMERRGPVAYASRPGFEAVDLPYGGAAFSMTIVLPDQGSHPADLLQGFSAQDWSALTAAFAERELVVRIPRLRIEWEANLNDVLKEMGMAVAFDPGQADFTPMFANALEAQVHISNVKQKTFVEVDEAGTRASAATSVEVGITSAPASFTVDRPFVFALRERLSGTILFVGVVEEVTGF